MFRNLALSGAALLALSALGFLVPASAETRASLGSSAQTSEPTANLIGLVGIAVKPGLNKTNKDGDKPYVVQQRKREPGAKWFAIGYFKTRQEAEKEKARCERSDAEDGHRDYDFQVVYAQSASLGSAPKKK